MDLLIACDGRYSKVREQAEGGAPPCELMDVANFKFVTRDTPESGLLDDYICASREI